MRSACRQADTSGMPARQKYNRAQIAKLYVEALATGIPITTTIASVLECSHIEATNAVRSARKTGWLGRAPHHPARAEIHRASKNPRTWLVCQECLVHWPCPQAYPVHPMLA